MSLFLFRGHLQCVLLCFVMAALNVYFFNIRGYHQGFPELLAVFPTIWATIPLTLRELRDGLPFANSCSNMILTLDCYKCILVCSHHIFVVRTVFDTVKKMIIILLSFKFI